MQRFEIESDQAVGDPDGRGWGRAHVDASFDLHRSRPDIAHADHDDGAVLRAHLHHLLDLAGLPAGST